MAKLITTLGDFQLEDLGGGPILPHEHVFVDMRGADHPDLGVADADAVVALMAPELARAREVGVAAVVVCTPVGVGRRADVELAVSRAADLPLVVPTGIYREPWIPRWAHEASEADLAAWMQAELEVGIGRTGVRAAWIKLSAGDDGLTRAETKVLRAAAAASLATGATIGSHTIRGRVALDQLTVAAKVGFNPDHFIWIHAHNETDLELHSEMAARGVWLEYDAIGSSDESDNAILSLVLRALGNGYGDRVLLSQDRGWYDPAKPGGGTPRPFAHLVTTFLPRLRESGVSNRQIDQITRLNPFRAFSR